MGRTSAIPASEEGSPDMYAVMMKHSQEVRWFILAPGLVSTSQAPDRETLIADYMRLPIYTPTKNAKKHAVMGEPYYPTRAEAERAIDCATAGAIPVSECSDPVLAETSGAQLPFDLMAS